MREGRIILKNLEAFFKKIIYYNQQKHNNITTTLYRVIQKDGLNFVNPYFKIRNW